MARIDLSQAVAVTTADAAATAVSAYTTRVRLVTTVGCQIALNRVVASGDAYLPPNWPEDFTVAPNDVIHVKAPTGTGTLYITEKR